MITTRFAPSPTGYLHIGGLRTALYSYLWAEKNGGKFLLRIEDTDLARNSKEATIAIKKAFEWTNLSYNNEIIYQSKRFDIYKKYIQQLLNEKKAYYCYMSREELEIMREEQKAKKERTKYNGKYRDFDGTPPSGIKPVIRIKSPQNKIITFVDGIKGEICVNSDDVLDDFIIARADGTPTYNFVVAIDDALMGINEVIRGDDHLSNTPKQIIVYEALGFEIPKFYHVPMILNQQGKKLSKRDGAMDVMSYKDEGILPEALLNFLIRLGWSNGDQEIFSKDEMLKLFDPSNINKSASAYNYEKLIWLNSHYIKNISYSKLIEELKFFGVDISKHNKKEILIDSLRERAKTLKEFAVNIKSIIISPTSYEEKSCKKWLKNGWKEILTKYIEHLENSGELESPKEFENSTNDFMQKNDIKLRNLAQPLRIAMVGNAVSPSVFDVISIIGKNELISRVEKLISEK